MRAIISECIIARNSFAWRISFSKIHNLKNAARDVLYLQLIKCRELLRKFPRFKIFVRLIWRIETDKYRGAHASAGRVFFHPFDCAATQLLSHSLGVLYITWWTTLESARHTYIHAYVCHHQKYDDSQACFNRGIEIFVFYACGSAIVYGFFFFFRSVE